GRAIGVPARAHERARVPAEPGSDRPAVAQAAGVALRVEHPAQTLGVGDSPPSGGQGGGLGDSASRGIGRVGVIEEVAEHGPGRGSIAEEVHEGSLDARQRGQSDRIGVTHRRTSPITRAAAATTAAPAMTAPATVAWRAARARVPWWASAAATCSEVVQ